MNLGRREDNPKFKNDFGGNKNHEILKKILKRKLLNLSNRSCWKNRKIHHMTVKKKIMILKEQLQEKNPTFARVLKIKSFVN